MSPASDDRARVTFFAAERRRLTRTAALVGFVRLVAMAPLETQPYTHLSRGRNQEWVL